ncbi:hypothetical protein MD484_g4268, partial [Candolleomyces efflorescens]
MTDSQLRQTWNQISSAANSIAAGQTTYASPAPQLPQSKVPGTPTIQSSAAATSAATTYVQPIYSQQPVVMPPAGAIYPPPVAATASGTSVYPVLQAPPPLSAVPPNPPKAPLPTRPQALQSTYASRLRTGASLLVQPILNNNTTSLLGGMTRSSRRGAVINYADPGSGDDLPDAGELDSDDSEFAASGGTRAAVRNQQPGTGVFHSVTGAGGGVVPTQQAQGPEKAELEQSYLGSVPPERFIKARKPMVPTPYEYPTPDVMLYQAQKRTSLVPIRVEFETDTLRIRDCFVWNINETLIKPENFARIFCNDLDLPLNPWAETIAAQIRSQLEEYQDVAALELGMDGAADPGESGEGLEELPDCRVILSIDVQIANHHLVDHIEWDLLSPLTPEDFARKLCAELGLTGEAIPLIAHAVHEELVKHKKDVIEWGVLAAAGGQAEQAESTPAPGTEGATPAPEKRDRSGYSLLKDKTGLGLGWGRAPRDGRGPKVLRSVWRDWADAEEFDTRFELFSWHSFPPRILFEMSTFTLLVDDQDAQINFLCPTLKQKVFGSYSNNTWSTIKSGSCSTGWFEYSFYGTGIKVDIPTAQPSQDVSVTLDNAPLTAQADGSFESSALPDGQHTLKYAIGGVKQAPVFDYLTVTAGPSTPINGRTLIVDDSQLSYKGNWSTNPPKALKYDYSTSLYRDTAHWSSTIGDTIEFEFTGTSVAVYGLAANIMEGSRRNNLTASYTIDGVTQTRGIPAETFDSVPMTEFFHADVPAGRHTLVINLTDVAYPRTFGIDFIAYNASVDSITSLPGYQPAANAAPKFEAGSSKLNGGAVAGIVVGTLALVGVLVAAGWFWRSRQAKKSKSAVGLGSGNSSYDDIEASKHAAQQRY